MWLVQCQRLDPIGPIPHMGPSLKKWLVQYLRLDQIGPMTHLGPGPISDIGPGPMWHMGLAYYWQVRVPSMKHLFDRPVLSTKQLFDSTVPSNGFFLSGYNYVFINLILSLLQAHTLYSRACFP